MAAKPVSTARNLLYHIIPGIAVTVVYLLLTALFPSPQVPKALLFYVAAFTIIPIMFLIMKKHSADGSVVAAVEFQKKQKIWIVLVFGLLSFLWAALVMTAAKPVTAWLFDNIFWWMKDRFDLSGYFSHPERYQKAVLILTWAVGLLTASTLVPVVEEYYFRGFLLPRLGKYGVAAVFLSALLFSLYHFFSPWMAVARFVALIPMTFFIWKFKDIRIGILCHVLLNFVGDTVSSVPAVFLS